MNIMIFIKVLSSGINFDTEESVLCSKDQLNVHQENVVSSSSYVSFVMDQSI